MNEMIKKGVVTSVIATAVVATGGTIAYSKLNKDDFKDIKPIVTLENQKVEVKETPIKIEQIKGIAKLNVLEVQSSKKVKYEKTSDFLWMSASRSIIAKYYFNTCYSIDLSKLDNKQIAVDNNNITIYIKGLDVKTELIEGMSEYEEVREGSKLVITKDVEISPQQLNDTIDKLKDKVNTECSEGVDYEEAVKYAEDSIELALNKLTNKSYNVNIISCK
ncbi:MAG: DUF4230 domain-containing protein [Romboutsia timonensis]